MPTVQIIKLSVLAFYLRLTPDYGFRMLVFVVAGVCSNLAAAWVTVVMFQCQPVAKAWAYYREGTCIDQAAFWQATGVLNIVLDFVLLILPVKMLKGLQVPYKQKIALYFLLSTGILCVTIYPTHPRARDPA